MFFSKLFGLKKSQDSPPAASLPLPASGGSIQKVDQETSRKMRRGGVKYNMKVIIRGERGVGKTCLLQRLQGNNFIEQYKPTPQISPAHINWNYKASDDIVVVEVWDVVDNAISDPNSPSIDGDVQLQKNLSQLVNNSPTTSATTSKGITLTLLDATVIDVYKHTHAVIFVFDITKRSSFDYIRQEIRNVPSQVSVILLANCKDLEEGRTLSDLQKQIASVEEELTQAEEEETRKKVPRPVVKEEPVKTEEVTTSQKPSSKTSQKESGGKKKHRKTSSRAKRSGMDDDELSDFLDDDDEEEDTYASTAITSMTQKSGGSSDEDDEDFTERPMQDMDVNDDDNEYVANYSSKSKTSTSSYNAKSNMSNASSSKLSTPTTTSKSLIDEVDSLYDDELSSKSTKKKTPSSPSVGKSKGANKEIEKPKKETPNSASTTKKSSLMEMENLFDAPAAKPSVSKSSISSSKVASPIGPVQSISSPIIENELDESFFSDVKDDDEDVNLDDFKLSKKIDEREEEEEEEEEEEKPKPTAKPSGKKQVTIDPAILAQIKPMFTDEDIKRSKKALEITKSGKLEEGAEKPKKKKSSAEGAEKPKKKKASAGEGEDKPKKKKASTSEEGEKKKVKKKEGTSSSSKKNLAMEDFEEGSSSAKNSSNQYESF